MGYLDWIYFNNYLNRVFQIFCCFGIYLFLPKYLINCLDGNTYLSVERGLVELRKLGLEQQLWETSRKEIEHNSPSVEAANYKHDAESENST